jgi:acyl-homoserine-lactone acylase
VPGGDGRYVWRRLHPLSALPQLLNPPGGYIQNANNPPWFVSRRDPLEADRFPAGIERGELALRPQLATELLEAREQFSVEDVRELKFNTRLLLADRVRADLIAAADAVAEPSEDLRTGRRVIGEWDGTAAATSVGTALFQRFWDTYRTATRAPFARAWNAEHPYDTPSGLADSPLAAKHLEEAVRWTRETYGSAAVAWGDVNRFRFGDIDLAGDGASGQLGAYRVVQFDAAQDGRRVAGRTETEGELAGFGDAWVLLVHLTRPLQAWSILAYGQSSRTGSLHGRDQIRLFAGHELRPVWFSADDIALHVERRYKP